MALIVKDRVQETSTTTGTGTFTLAGANSGFQTFSSAVGNGNTTYYAIVGGTEWEVGIGTVGAGTLARTTLLASSTGSAISFSAGIKNVFCTYPASKSVTIDDIQTLTNKTINLASNTLTGTTAQFNTALSDGDFATLAGTETLTNKALNGTLGATTPSTIVATTTTSNSFIPNLSTVPTNGLYLPATNSVGLSTNSTERVRIDSNGNVSVGTTSSNVSGQNANVRIATIQGINNYWGGVEVSNALVGTGTLLGFYGFTCSGSAAGYTMPAYIGTWLNDSGTATKLGGNIRFHTQADNTVGAAERMRLTSTGMLQFDSGYGSVANAYGCRAWVNFNGTGTIAIRANGNVSSITDNGVGDYTVNFTTAMPDGNYSSQIYCSNVGSQTFTTYVANLANYATSSFRFITGYVSSLTGAITATDANTVSVGIFR